MLFFITTPLLIFSTSNSHFAVYISLKHNYLFPIIFLLVDPGLMINSFKNGFISLKIPAHCQNIFVSND